MTQDQIMEVLNTCNAIITNNHFVYTSGKHGSAYVNKDTLYPHTKETSLLCEEIARVFSSDPVDAVIGPAFGGIILSQWVAYHLSQIVGKEIPGVYAEKAQTPEGFAVTRGYDAFIRGKNVLIVEDILTTGGSARKVVDLIRLLGGNVIGLGVICNRGGVTAHDVGDVPKFIALCNVSLEAWDEKDCQLCAHNIPVHVSIGKGREFMAKKAATA